MAFELFRRLRGLALVSTLALTGGLALGCVADAGEPGAASEDVTDVDHSAVKRQSIGNCWIYATASWAESLHKSATGEEANLSESYWTYWHWYDQILRGMFGSTEISTGGSYNTAIDIIDRYGMMAEGDFIADESQDEMSWRQKTALAAINASLKTGALSTWEARSNRETVRRELDKAWGLDADVVATLDAVFGADVSKTIDRTYKNGPTPDAKVVRSKDFAARVKQNGAFVAKTLADVIGTKSSSWSSTRSGAQAWKEVNYPKSASARRDFHKRIQRALHDGQPVIISWFVDFNSLDDKGAFAAPPATPGHQGGHMTVMEDYEIENVPGYGTLKAGELVTDPAILNAALSSSAAIKFFRVKNSWGTYRVDRAFALPGYHDLHLEYLNGPVQKCGTTASGETDTDNCYDHVPFWSVVLPAGY